MTVAKLIEKALKKIGVLSSGQTPDADQYSDGLDALNDLISFWSSQRLGVYTIANISHTLTVGDGVYTIGSTGDIAETRPFSILSAYLRRNGVDYKVTRRSREYFDSLFDKDVSGIPEDFYYEPTYPDGTITVYPYPDAADTLYLRVWQPMTEYTATTEEISLPKEYETALVFNLARDIASEYGVAIPNNVAARAAETVDVLKRLHSQPVPQVRTGLGRKPYNIYTDS